MSGPRTVLWSCRRCGGQFRLPPEHALPLGVRIRCPACATLSPPLLPGDRQLLILGEAAAPVRGPGEGPWGRLVAVGSGWLIIALLLLTVGVQVVRSRLLPAARPARASIGVVQAIPSARPPVETLEQLQVRLEVEAAWELYVAGRNRQAVSLLQALAPEVRGPEEAKLLSRALRRAGLAEPAAAALREYRQRRAQPPVVAPAAGGD